MIKIDLCKDWHVRYAPLYKGIEEAPSIATAKKDNFISQWMKTDIPCDVHTPLIENGIIKEPLEGLNSFDCEWIEGKSWWFKKSFQIPSDFFKNEKIELVLDYIDLTADFLLNGLVVGRHQSVHYPFIADVTKYVHEGENELIVRVTTGTENINDKMTAPFATTVNKTYRRGDERRVFLRKPQYVFGWDWGPRVVTCGLCGEAYLAAYDKTAIRGINIVTESITDSPITASVLVTVEVENLDPIRTREAEISVSVSLREKKVTSVCDEFLLRSGINYIDFRVQIENAELWWPNGMGEQPMYDIDVMVRCQGGIETFGPVKAGLRTLKLNLEKLKSPEHLFAIEVNGIKTFCKGSDWIPADAIYARVPSEKYRALIMKAREANFTMLRIWGGGIYEKDEFYHLCDEMGILIWQDLMFACASYPDRNEDFIHLCEREIDYQTRRLRNHPCLALWCGNNENQWAFDSQWKKDTEYFGGSIIYDKIAPELIRYLSPHIPYWNSSPYGGEEPNANEVGDRHHWNDCTMNPDMEKRITPEDYDKVSSKFITEYGYIGPCSLSSIKKYHGGEPIIRFSELWNWHNNTFEKDTVLAGISKHYIDAENLSLEDYLLYAGICQGMMLSYSLESIRSKENCWGGLFWMYTDCWGEVGWTIIDYYLKCKPSWFYVKRSFAPIKLIMRAEASNIITTGINETPNDFRVPVEYGYISFDGKDTATKTAEIHLPHFSRDCVLRFPMGNYDLKEGILFVKPLEIESSDMNNRLPEKALFRADVFRNLDIQAPKLNIENFSEIEKGMYTATISTDVFAHAVHFDMEEDSILEEVHFSDNYFDLLPGEKKTVTLKSNEPSLDRTCFTLKSIYNKR